MNDNNYLEPYGFLYKEAAHQAIASQIALPFGTNEIAFTFVKVIQEGIQSPLIPVTKLDKAQQIIVKKLSWPLPLAGLPAGSQVMGILNITPDSFSNGGEHFRIEHAVRAGHQMVADGATILDIGGESTRPGSQEVSVEEECARVIPVIKALKGCGALLSIDTRHTDTMRQALDAGIDMINDISALTDKNSAALIAEAGCPVILMHMRGNPQTMMQFTSYKNVVLEVLQELEQRIQIATQSGIARENIIVDPGIGFAKDTKDNITLIQHLPAFANLGCRLLLGVSRKRFIQTISQVSSSKACDPGTIAASLPASILGGSVIRVHNVPAMRQALCLWEALKAF